MFSIFLFSFFDLKKYSLSSWDEITFPLLNNMMLDADVFHNASVKNINLIVR